MILVSAALVLAAIVLLIAGVVLGTPPLVMWSIVVSVLSAVCLLIGALLRRHELFPAGGRAAEGTAPTPQGSSVPQLAHAGAVSGAYGPTLAGAPAHPVATPMVAAPPVTHHGALPPHPFPPQPAQTGPIARPSAVPGRGLAPDAIVLVIPGRKRFHLATCRQLVGRETEELTHEEAREEGFTPCTTCLPEISARMAEAEEAALRDDVVRDEPLRGEAGPTTASRVEASARTEPEQPLPAADRGTAVPGLPQAGVPSATPALPSTAVPGPRLSEPPAAIERKPEEPAKRDTPRESQKPADADIVDAEIVDGEIVDAEIVDADETGREDSGGHGHLTPVDWFGRSIAQAPGAATPSPSEPAPPEQPSSSSSSSAPSAPSWPSAASRSTPAWSPPASGAGSAPEETDPDDDSDTDTAEHDWFRPGRGLPWEPARARSAEAEADTQETPEEPSEETARETARETAATEEPVEPAETPEPGRAGFAASTGSTSGTSPAAGATGDGSARKSPKSGASGPQAADEAPVSEDASGDAEASTPKGDPDGETQVRVMVGTRRYHSDACPLISGMGDAGIEVMTRAEAEDAGLTPCSVCQGR